VERQASDYKAHQGDDYKIKKGQSFPMPLVVHEKRLASRHSSTTLVEAFY